MPIVIKSNSALRDLQDQPMYLAVKLGRRVGAGRPLHALIEIPTDIPRFLVLPKVGQDELVMFLDDVIRFGLPLVFEPTNYDTFESYAVKFTRDAEMEFDNDFMDSLYEQLSEGLKAREGGDPVRINYDANMPKPFLRLVMNALDVVGDEDSKFPGARYHNRRDLLKFPSLAAAISKLRRSGPLRHRGSIRKTTTCSGRSGPATSSCISPITAFTTSSTFSGRPAWTHWSRRSG